VARSPGRDLGLPYRPQTLTLRTQIKVGRADYARRHVRGEIGETGDYAGKTAVPGRYEQDVYIKPALDESVCSQGLLQSPQPAPSGHRGERGRPLWAVSCPPKGCPVTAGVDVKLPLQIATANVAVGGELPFTGGSSSGLYIGDGVARNSANASPRRSSSAFDPTVIRMKSDTLGPEKCLTSTARSRSAAERA
jgi:hypothetical protein